MGNGVKKWATNNEYSMWAIMTMSVLKLWQYRGKKLHPALGTEKLFFPPNTVITTPSAHILSLTSKNAHQIYNGLWHRASNDM